LQLGAWSLALSAVPAGISQLEAWRLKLGAFFFQLLELHNILGGKMSLQAVFTIFISHLIPSSRVSFFLYSLHNLQWKILYQCFYRLLL